MITFNVLFPSHSILYVPFIKPEGFDTCDYKDREIKEKLNFDLKKISLNNLFEESNKIKKNKIIKNKSMIAKTLKDTKKLNQKEYDKSI